MKSLKFALKQIVPLLPSYVFVGIAVGILLNSAGYSPLWALVSGALIYAGSMQIVMITLMTSGASLAMIAIMTLFVNARHIFYGIGMLDRFKQQGWKCPFMALTLTDETYSVLCALKYPEDTEPQKVDFNILLCCYLLWIISCTVGALFGQMMPESLTTGIEFSATAFFTVVVINQWKEYPTHIPAIAGFASAIFFWVILGPGNFILPALSVSVVVMIVLREKITDKMGVKAE